MAQASWLAAMDEHEAQVRGGNWREHAHYFRAYIHLAGPSAMQVVCAEYYFLLSQLVGMYERVEDPSERDPQVWLRFFDHFRPVPADHVWAEPEWPAALEHVEKVIRMCDFTGMRMAARLLTETRYLHENMRQRLRLHQLV